MNMGLWSAWNEAKEHEKQRGTKGSNKRNLFSISKWKNHTHTHTHIHLRKIVDANFCGRLAIRKVTHLFISCLNAFPQDTVNLKLSLLRRSHARSAFFHFSIYTFYRFPFSDSIAFGNLCGIYDSAKNTFGFLSLSLFLSFFRSCFLTSLKIPSL